MDRRVRSAVVLLVMVALVETISPPSRLSDEGKQFVCVCLQQTIISK